MTHASVRDERLCVEGACTHGPRARSTQHAVSRLRGGCWRAESPPWGFWTGVPAGWDTPVAPLPLPLSAPLRHRAALPLPRASRSSGPASPCRAAADAASLGDELWLHGLGRRPSLDECDTRSRAGQPRRLAGCAISTGDARRSDTRTQRAGPRGLLGRGRGPGRPPRGGGAPATRWGRQAGA